MVAEQGKIAWNDCPSRARAAKQIVGLGYLLTWQFKVSALIDWLDWLDWAEEAVGR